MKLQSAPLLVALLFVSPTWSQEGAAQHPPVETATPKPAANSQVKGNQDSDSGWSRDNSGAIVRNGHSTNTGSGNAGTVSNSRQECSDAIIKQFPEIDKSKSDRICSWDEVRSVILERQRDNWSVKKNEYIQCVNVFKSLNYSDELVYSECATTYKNRNFLSRDFPKCFNSISAEFGSRSAYNECKDERFLKEYDSPKFNTCKENLKEFSRPASEILNKCGNFVDRERISSKGFERCVGILKTTRLDKDSTFRFCTDDNNLKNMARDEFKDCQRTVARMTPNIFNQIAVCANSDGMETARNNPRCLEASLASAYKSYAANVAFFPPSNNSYNGYNYNYSGDKNYFHFMGRDCRSQDRPKITPNSYLKLIKDINIQTNEILALEDSKQRPAQVGGLSALSYDPNTQILYMLSDETRMNTQLPPRMYTYKLSNQLDLQDNKVMMFSFGKQTEPDIDPEGLYRLKDGSFIVSSEVGKEETEENQDKSFSITNLNIFDSSGRYKDSISLPPSFKTQYEKVTVTPAPAPAPKPKKDGGGFWDKVFGGGDSTSPAPQKPYSYSKLVGGLKFNKSLEALSVSPNETSLFIANESSLIQDENLKGKCPPKSDRRDRSSRRQNGAEETVSSYTTSPDNPSILVKKEDLRNRDNNSNQDDYRRCGEVVRIARYAKNESLKELFQYSDEFKYELEPEADNGIVELLALDDTTLLTLERSFDNAKQKVTSRIFKIELTEDARIHDKATSSQIDSIKALQKKLILDLDDIIPQLSPGFRILDNFEGMTFGPTLPNGNRTLLLVSDNNYRTKQRTALLVFEVSSNLLQK